MTSDETETPEEEQDRKASGKGGGKEGSGAPMAASGQVSPAFFEYMARIGASMEQITRILRDWTHLKGKDLAGRMADFARDIARASAQALVKFDGKDFALVTNFLLFLSGDDRVKLANRLGLSPEERHRLGLN